MGLLDGTVVVVSGLGPGLGRSIELQSARAGADIVLAARTASRLDEVAGEVIAPEPDAVADAVVFLASPMAQAVTGQCLDVNAGEYHR